MEKCWFVLRQTHYPAPEYAHPGMAFGEAEGPIRLGHFIPDPRKIDSVINSDGITPFPSNMRIWPTKAVDFHLSNATERGIEKSLKAGPAIAAAGSMTVRAEAGVVFKRVMGETWEIDGLETQIVQPTMRYLEQCRQSAQLAAWVEKSKVLGSWKAYMVSGLIIARGAKLERKGSSTNEVYGGGNADLLGSATAEAKVGHTNNKEINISAQYVDDFVWAIRLTEVSKALFGSDLSQKVVKKGAVFAPPTSVDVDVNAVLAEASLGGDDVHPLQVFNGDEQQFLIAIDGH